MRWGRRLPFVGGGSVRGEGGEDDRLEVVEAAEKVATIHHFFLDLDKLLVTFF